MAAGERLILVTDGITERQTETGGRFGLNGIRGAIEGVESATAAASAMAILQAVSDCCRDPLEATVRSSSSASPRSACA